MNKEFNKLCAKFLGWTLIENTDGELDGYWVSYESIESGLPTVHFHKDKNVFCDDWNFLILVKTKICKLDVVSEFMVEYDAVFSVSVYNTYRNTFDKIHHTASDEKTALLNAIYEFLKWYNQ